MVDAHVRIKGFDEKGKTFFEDIVPIEVIDPVTYIRCGNLSCGNEVLLHESQVEQATEEGWLCDFCDIKGGYAGI